MCSYQGSTSEIMARSGSKYEGMIGEVGEPLLPSLGPVGMGAYTKGLELLVVIVELCTWN